MDSFMDGDIVGSVQRIVANALTGVAALALLALTSCAPASTRSQPTKDVAGQQQKNPNALTVIAEIALQRGDCKTAAESYAAAAAEGDGQLAKRASQVALACEHLPAAWDSVTRWRALAPEDSDAAAVYATVALKLYRIPDASAAVRALVRSAGGEAETRLAELAALLLDEADSVAVLATMSDALEPGTLSPTTLALLGELALRAYDTKRAVRYAEKALEGDPTSVAAKRVLARAYVIQGNADRAIAIAREVARAGGGRNAFELADILSALARLEEARQELERLRAADVSPGEVDRRLALLAFQSGDLSEAEQRFTTLIERGEATDSMLLYLADIAARSGDLEAALAGYRRLADSQLAITARSRAAALLLQHDNRAEALTLLDEYVTEHPESSFELTVVKAHLLADHGETRAGLELLDSALQRHPRHPALEYDRAILLERAGRVPEAIEALEKLLEQRPNDPTLLNALGYTLADHGLQLPRAESLIRRALATVPDNPAVLDSLGWVRFRRGDIPEALTILERAYNVGRDPEIAAHWGEVLWVSGAQQEARKVWAMALARDPESAPLKATLARLLPSDNTQ